MSAGMLILVALVIVALVGAWWYGKYNNRIAIASRRKLRIYLCSPFRGPDENMNVDFARRVARELSLAGAVVFCPHIFFTQFLNDHVESERNIGIENGQQIMSTFDEAWFVTPPWRNSMSVGMIWDQKVAKKFKLRCFYALSPESYKDLLGDLKRDLGFL